MKALITGVAGQDGTLLSQQLLAEGFEVVGLVKPGHDTSTLLRYAPQITVVSCDLGDPIQLEQLIIDQRPDQIYNLGGISSLVEAAEQPELTRRINVGAVESILSATRQLAQQGFQLRFVRSEGLFATAAILYNHESPLRGEGFVTRRITQAVARIAAGQQAFLELGNLDVSRDWGWAPDYVRAMRLMLAAEVPHDYVLATGQSHELTDFIAVAFKAAGIDDWQSLVRSNDDLRRHTDPTLLRGDSSRAYAELGWQHTKNFQEMAQSMVRYDQLLLDEPTALWHEA